MKKIIFAVLISIICCTFFTSCDDGHYYERKDGTVTVVTRGKDIFGNNTTTSRNMSRDDAMNKKIANGIGKLILKSLFSSGK